jgi:hypothetical protein
VLLNDTSFLDFLTYVDGTVACLFRRNHQYSTFLSFFFSAPYFVCVTNITVFLSAILISLFPFHFRFFHSPFFFGGVLLINYLLVSPISSLLPLTQIRLF